MADDVDRWGKGARRGGLPAKFLGRLASSQQVDLLGRLRLCFTVGRRPGTAGALCHVLLRGRYSLTA